MQSTKTISRIIGILFISAFFFYGYGNYLVDDYLKSNSFNKQNSNSAIIGAVLMLINSVVVLVIGILINKLFKKNYNLIAKAYLFARIIEAFCLAFGTIFLLQVVNLSLSYENNNITLEVLNNRILTAQNFNFEFYNLGMLVLAMSSILFFRFLKQTKYLPTYLSTIGILSYSTFAIGTLLELLGQKILGEQTGIYLSIPGGVFEFVLGVWLIVKGFDFEN